MSDQVHALVAQAKAANVTGVIVDLRDNPGGLLFEVIAAIAPFAPSKALMNLEFLDANDQIYQYEDGRVKISSRCGDVDFNSPVTNPTEWMDKVAILTTKYSASGSEVFTQLVKQDGRAIAIGEETFGIGDTSVLTFPIGGGRGIAVTDSRSKDSIGNYLTPTVKPDIFQRDDWGQLIQGKDLALDAAIAHFR